MKAAAVLLGITGAAAVLSSCGGLASVGFSNSSAPTNLTLAVLPTPPGAPSVETPAKSAQQLVGRVLDARRSAAFQVRATLTITRDGRSVARELVMKSRRERNRVMTLYELVRPAAVAGQAVVVRESGARPPSGFLYASGTARRLTSAALSQPFFDSDLRIGDLSQGFWRWPSPTAVGKEDIEEYSCVIIEFRPPVGAATPYSFVRAWVSPQLLLALRIEQFNRQGRLDKRIGLYRVVKVDQRWLPTLLTVEPAHGRSRTAIEGTRLTSTPHLAAADFTIGALRRGADRRK